ncbi:MAG TPA: nitroreductase family protein [Methanobacteriaceae archaeon]|nr:nitroreductase family protein [Methanobacteriaceae archaeon]
MLNRKLNTKICLKCGTCAVDCPMGLIEMKDYPEVPKESEIFCNQCGHCEVICPEGAIDSLNFATDGIKAVSTDKDKISWEEIDISPEQMELYMKFRRSIRHYNDQVVEKEVLEKLFDLVRYAPSAGNGQPVQWIVFTDRDKIREIAGRTIEWMREISKQDSPLNEMIPFSSMVEAWDNGMDPILRNSPCLVVAHAPKENMMAAGDGMIALTHLDLALPSFGMGGCWAGLLNIAYSQYPPLKSMLGIPDENNIIYPFMVGYPKYKYHGIPERNKPNITWK